MLKKKKHHRDILGCLWGWKAQYKKIYAVAGTWNEPGTGTGRVFVGFCRLENGAGRKTRNYLPSHVNGNVACGGDSKHFSSTFDGSEQCKVCCLFYSELMLKYIEGKKEDLHVYSCCHFVCVCACFFFSCFPGIDQGALSFFLVNFVFLSPFFQLCASYAVKHASSISSPFTVLCGFGLWEQCWTAEEAMRRKLLKVYAEKKKGKTSLIVYRTLPKRKTRAFSIHYKNISSFKNKKKIYTSSACCVVCLAML